MRKIEQKQECQKLRKEQGLSVKQIAKQVGVSQSSVSLWTRDIQLSEAQQKSLNSNNPLLNRYLYRDKQANSIAKTWRERRTEFQNIGKKKAQQKSWLHTVGCMLYWAEGSKDKNCIKFSNSDFSMMKLFLRFLREEMKVEEDQIIFTSNVHLNNNLTLEEIENHWLKELNLSSSSLRKSTVSRLPRMSSGKKKNKLPYGVGRITICSTELVQHIFGAIQEYGNFKNDKWLD